MADETEMESRLPEDVLIEILARLPVKSLVKITCVCKYWMKIIKSPSFAMKHYAKSLNRLSHVSQNYDCFLTAFSPACSISVCCADETLALKTAFKFRPAVSYEPPRFEISHNDVITDYTIYGPCNGLLLLFLYKRNSAEGVALLLWNPATREVFKLPENNYDFASTVVGLGFDHVTNDYKVINFHGGICTGDPSLNASLIPLYSLAANSWRQVDGGFEFEYLKKRVCNKPCYTSSSSNGSKIHFLLSDGSTSAKKFIYSLVTFDMVDEVFVQTAMPDEIAVGHHYFGRFLSQGSSSNVYPTIYSFGNKASRGIYDPIEVHIWVLEGYGSTGFWNKQRSIIVPTSGEVYTIVQLWAITSYNFTGEQLCSLRMLGKLGDGEIYVGYTESIVSIASRVTSAVETDTEPGGSVLQDEEEDDDCSLVQVQENHEEDEDEDEDDDDDCSSTDSAFLAPPGIGLFHPFVDYDFNSADRFSNDDRQKEWKRLCNLPYCLREVNQPMISNPSTF